jgi:hypothetical protein
MKHFTIDNETNNITVYGSATEAEAVPNSQRFTTEAQLAKLAADSPVSRLVEIWNSLPGVTPVTKFKDRATGVSRIWKAIQMLGGAESSQAETEPVAEPTVSTSVAPQVPDVAPEAAPSDEQATPAETPAETASIDKEKCIRLLHVAASAQGEYWDTLRNLEEAIGFEINDPGDLDETSIDELIEQYEARRKPRASSKGVRENSKTSQVIAMLKREAGTTLEEIMTAMGWQKHTTRAMLSAGGSLVKKHGLSVTSEMVGEQRRYFIKG